MTINRTAENFVEWANETLVSLGIGKYDDGSRWYYYEIDDEGNVRANDYSESIVCDDWESITYDDLESEASAYKNL